MAPISPNGPGNPYSGSGHIIPLRANPSVLQPLPRAVSRPLLRTRPTRAGRANRTGAGGTHVETGTVFNDDDAPFDPTNKFRRRSSSPDQDTITLSERVASYIGQLRSAGRLRIWSPNLSELFSWGAQSVKGFVSYRFGLERPGLVDVVPYGYQAGGGY